MAKYLGEIRWFFLKKKFHTVNLFEKLIVLNHQRIFRVLQNVFTRVHWSTETARTNLCFIHNWLHNTIIFTASPVLVILLMALYLLLLLLCYCCYMCRFRSCLSFVFMYLYYYCVLLMFSCWLCNWDVCY